MSYSYVLSYDTRKVSQDEVYGYLKNNNDITAWYAPFPGTAIVISDASASDLSEAFINSFGEFDHLFTDITADEQDTQGWLDEEAWNYINNPEDFS